jgi:primosomal protein N' (replication factor Y)
VIVDVVLPLPVEQTYTYRVPSAMADDARVGCRVLVPFGPRRMTGLIVAHPPEQSPDDFPFTVKAVLDVLDETPAFTPEMLRLTRWMADYYVCAWGEVVKAALPSGTDVEERRRLARTDTPPGDWADHATARAVLRYLEAHDEATVSGVRQQVGDVPLALLRRLERDGLLTMTKELTAPKVRVKTATHLRFAPAFQHPSAPKDLKAQLRGHKQVAVIEVMAGFRAEGVREPPQTDVMDRAQAAHSTVRSLLDKGMLEAVQKEVLRTPLGDLPAPPTPPERVLHPAQQQALDALTEAVAAERFETFLLHGVTGSGKTEVYIAALKDVLARGKTGIILVPEIALTPQTVQRFRAHFGDRIAVLHSRMSLGERYDAWRHLRSGRFDVAIGPRSAVLAPLDDLGLIVVDEEHEPSYKQFDPAPRYHARDVAVVRALRNDAVCILGSATPSLESIWNARQGKYTLLEMPDRVPVPGHDAAPLPPVRIVDLTLERKKHRLEGALSETLREAIRVRLGRNEQVILLQNRRGYAPVVECQDCGWTPMCHDCSVSLTYHKAKRHLRCHYCGRARQLPRACPSCGSRDLAQLGQGTQRVEEELAQVFPEATVARMDLDTTSRKDAHHTILSRFGEGEADILIGTQMVAKGLDFPRVTLVGVVNADVGMHLPDFRAEERTFQLLTQVAGRAGRAELRGEVLLQTRQPDHPVFQHVLEHDYAAFVEEALPDRRRFGYPPYAHVVGVEFRGPEEDAVQQIAQRWTTVLCQALGREEDDPVEVLGPEPALVGRVKRQYRYHTILKVPRGRRTPRIQEVLRAVNDEVGSLPKNSRLAIDVDAIGLF